MTAFFNIGSLVLGLGAWALGALALCGKKTTAGSFALCAVSLLLQLAEIAHRVRIGDLSAVADTAHGIWLAASVLVGGTLVLWAATRIKAYKRAK